MLNQCREEDENLKKIGPFQNQISHKLATRLIFFKFGVHKVVYMEGIKYINLVQISPEIRGVENGNLVVFVHDTCVQHVFPGHSLTHDRVL